MSLNRVILMGNLTRDPELSHTASNAPVCKFGMATNRKWADRDGNKKEEVCYVDVTAWGKMGEVINQYMAKGRGILIEGRLQFSQWTDKEGKNRSKLDVVAESFSFVGEKGDGQGQNRGGGRAAPASEERSDPPPMPDDGDVPQDSSIPF